MVCTRLFGANHGAKEKPAGVTDGLLVQMALVRLREIGCR
jgi:hypothetical protein